MSVVLYLVEMVHVIILRELTAVTVSLDTQASLFWKRLLGYLETYLITV